VLPHVQGAANVAKTGVRDFSGECRISSLDLQVGRFEEGLLVEVEESVRRSEEGLLV
jgi:hypothetical protein